MRMALMDMASTILIQRVGFVIMHYEFDIGVINRKVKWVVGGNYVENCNPVLWYDPLFINGD